MIVTLGIEQFLSMGPKGLRLRLLWDQARWMYERRAWACRPFALDGIIGCRIEPVATRVWIERGLKGLMHPIDCGLTDVQRICNLRSSGAGFTYVDFEQDLRMEQLGTSRLVVMRVDSCS